MDKIDRKYKEWFGVKADIQARKNKPHFKEWQIWWCAVGENVGVEINGKGMKFARPIVVYRKLSEYGFVGIPLTTQDHTETSPDWYVHFRFRGIDEYAALHQVESVSVYRLYRFVGTLDDEDIDVVKNGFRKLYIKNTPSIKKGVAGESRI